MNEKEVFDQEPEESEPGSLVTYLLKGTVSQAKIQETRVNSEVEVSWPVKGTSRRLR